MREPIQILMKKVRCPGWPACVEEIYEKAMARYDAEGCFLTDPAYYASLAERHGILQTELDTFQRAAVAVGQNEAYSRYLLLIYVFGMIYILTEFQELGIAGLVITLVLGNVCFFLLDRVLTKRPRRKCRG